jgi:hypothetical protein
LIRDRDRAIASGIAVTACAFYVSLLSINPDSNGIVTARAVELGHVVTPNHMLFEVLGLVTMQASGSLGYSGKAFPVLQVVAALCGGITLAGVYLAGRGISENRIAAVIGLPGLGRAGLS